MGKASAIGTPDPLAVKPRQAARMFGLGLTRMHELISTGEVDSYLDGGSRMVTVASIKRRIERKVAEAKAAPEPQPPPAPEPPPAPKRGRKHGASGERPAGDQPAGR